MRALSSCSSTRDSPITISAASPPSSSSPSSLASPRDMPLRRCPPTPPTIPPTAAAPMTDGGNRIPTRLRPRYLPMHRAASASRAFDVDLAVGVLGDQRDVIGADELRGVQLEQAVVVGERIRAVGVGRRVDENGSVAHVISSASAWQGGSFLAFMPCGCVRSAVSTPLQGLRTSLLSPCIGCDWDGGALNSHASVPGAAGIAGHARQKRSCRLHTATARAEWGRCAFIIPDR